MNHSTHYNLNLVEGTDIVNPLNVDKPNYEIIDNAMYQNSIRNVGTANCIKTGTVHAVTRDNPDCNAFRFTATGNWLTGDTMTIDGGAVSVFLPNGEAPQNNSFVINTEVFGILNGTRVTLYTSPNKPTISADEVDFNGTDNVEDAILKIGNGIAIVSNGEYTSTDTWAVPAEARALIDSGKNYLVVADFFYGTYSSGKRTRIIQHRFGNNTVLALNRAALEIGMVLLAADNFSEYGFSTNIPKLRTLVIIPLETY